MSSANSCGLVGSLLLHCRGVTPFLLVSYMPWLPGVDFKKSSYTNLDPTWSTYVKDM